jgi:hypothetical protein
MPDGAIVSIEAAGTDLDLRPLKGKVEGQMSDDFFTYVSGRSFDR